MPRRPAKPRRTLSPLEYMLRVINNPKADPARRDRLAVCAAQYTHSRAVELRATKREAAAADAKRAGRGSQWAADLTFPNGRSRQ